MNHPVFFTLLEGVTPYSEIMVGDEPPFVYGDG